MRTAPAPRIVPRPHRYRLLKPLAAILALAVVGCGAAQRHVPTELPSHLPIASTPTPARAPGASVRFLTPAADSVQPATFTARVSVGRFILQDAQAGDDPLARHGHLHFIFDGGRYDQPQFSGANGREALRLGVNGYYSPAYDPTITYKHIPPGEHTLEVELVNRNDTPTDIRATIHFSVR
jgi:hypothetical protein